MDMEFELPKSFADIRPPVIVEPRVYRLALTNRAKEKNKAGTGFNAVLTLAIIDEAPPVEGLEFQKWLSLPNPTDEGRMARGGQPLVDWKMESIQKNVEALGGKIEGNKFSLPEHATCKAFVDRLTDDNGSPFNQIEGDLMPDDKPKGRQKS